MINALGLHLPDALVAGLGRLPMTRLLAESAPTAGRFAFAGVFALLIVWLWLVPASRLSDQGPPAPWWRRSRVWATAIAASQLLVYLFWS